MVSTARRISKKGRKDTRAIKQVPPEALFVRKKARRDIL